MTPKIRIFNHEVPLPRSRIARVVVGVLLIIGGLAGFLPVLGFWMIPLGLLVLSVDLPIVRRWRRQLSVWWAGRREHRRAARGEPPSAGAGKERENKGAAAK